MTSNRQPFTSSASVSSSQPSHTQLTSRDITRVDHNHHLNRTNSLLSLSPSLPECVRACVRACVSVSVCVCVCRCVCRCECRCVWCRPGRRIMTRIVHVRSVSAFSVASNSNSNRVGISRWPITTITTTCITTSPSKVTSWYTSQSPSRSYCVSFISREWTLRV